MEEKITAWIARDKNNKLFLFFQKPHKSKYYNVWECIEECYSDNQEINDSELYSQVKWEDEEPTKVELTIKICK